MLRVLSRRSYPSTDRLQISIFLMLSYYFCLSLDSLFANVQKPKFSSIDFFTKPRKSAGVPIKRVQPRMVGLWLLADESGNEYESKVILTW